MSSAHRSSRWSVIAIVAIVAMVSLATAWFYGVENGGSDALACRANDQRLAAIRPLARGDLAAFSVPQHSQKIPDLQFSDSTGAPRSLADWQGRTVLLNIWATWCAPCRYEMPALDRLQATLGSDDFEVVAVNIDTGNPDRPIAFLDEVGISSLQRYADPETAVFKDLKAVGRAPGMPTTLLIDGDGCELGFLAGPAEWDSPDALNLIRAAMAPAS